MTGPSQYASRRARGRCGWCGCPLEHPEAALCPSCKKKNVDAQSRRRTARSGSRGTPAVSPNGSLIVQDPPRPPTPVPGPVKRAQTRRVFLVGQGWVEFEVYWQGADKLLPRR